MSECAHCGGETDARYRFCPWCASPQRQKLVEFFRGADADAGRALRVSRYLPEQRVRFSVWDETGTARAAVSLDEQEAHRLAGYLAPSVSEKPRLLDELKTLVRL
jgi:hypothetical protein